MTNLTAETLGTSGADNDHTVFSRGIFLHWNARNGPRPNLVNAQAIAGDTPFSLQPQLPGYVAVRYELTPKTAGPAL